MQSRRFPFLRVAILALSCQSYAGAQSAPPSFHYQVTVTRESGLTRITFDTPTGPAELDLPTDLVAGEQFSGRLHLLYLGGAGNYFVLEAAGQRTTTPDKHFTWRVPSPDAGGGMAFVLRSINSPNVEVARVHVPVLTRAPIARPPLGSAKGDFFVPPVGKSGAVFPIIGPFDGDRRRTSFTVGGVDAEVLAESPRQTLVRLPEGTAGLVPYVLKHDGAERRGTLRSVDIQTTYPTATTGNQTRGQLVIAMKGLGGLSREIGLQIENRTPFLMSTGDPIVFVNPNEVRADGTYRWARPITVDRKADHPIQIAVSLIIPTSAEEEVAFILQVPRRDMRRLPDDEHADVLRPYLPGVLTILADFLPDYRNGWPAYRAMVALDADAAAPLILKALPAIFRQQSAGSAINLYVDRVTKTPALPYRQQLHDAAVQLMESDTTPAQSTSWGESQNAAIRALGLIGNEADLPLLERLYQRWDLRVQAEASLARLGSQPHIANIKATLDAPLSQPFTETAAHRIAETLRSAGFSGRSELIPSVCRHLQTPGFGEADVTTVSPGMDALMALGRLVGHSMSSQEVARLCAAK